METLKSKLTQGIFVNFISLGCCCYVAGDLERMGLRNSSMPFDWTRTRLRVIKDALFNQFENYLLYDDLYQYKNNPHIYEGCDAGVVFPHDFVAWRSLKSQFSNVKEKYQRRINRFFIEIEKPTVVIRYCWDEEELNELLQTYDEWTSFFKKYNENNEFVIITHNGIREERPEQMNIFFVEKGEDGKDNLNPIRNCPELYVILNEAKFKNREKNIQHYEKKCNGNRTLKERVQRKWFGLQKKRRKTYVHNKQV